MLEVQFAAAVRDELNFFSHRDRVVGDPIGFDGGVQAFLQFRIMGSDARGTGILIALQGLYASEREHKAPR